MNSLFIKIHTRWTPDDTTINTRSKNIETKRKVKNYIKAKKTSLIAILPQA